jgi:transcriptional regulator with XRE-family HTH domain
MDNSPSTEPQSAKLRAVADRLRIAREHAGLDQQQFADRIGFSRRQVVAWETAANAPPIWALEAVREHLNIDPEWVLSGPGDLPLVDVGPDLRERGVQLRNEVARMIRDAGMILPDESVQAVEALMKLAPPGSEREAKRHIRLLLGRVAK